MQANFIVSLLFSILVVFFAVLNADVVTINLFFKDFSVSQALVIFISAFLGATVAFTFDIIGKMKRKKNEKALNKQIMNLSEELKKAKNESELYKLNLEKCNEDLQEKASVTPSEE